MRASSEDDGFVDAPLGGTLGELYDLEAGRPLAHYRELWDRVAGELRELGLPVRPYDDCGLWDRV